MTRDSKDFCVRFPLLTGLQVEGYGLFPGKRGKGLKAALPSGLTLVLGANGLGKTTLVWIMYRLISGPYDIPGLDTGGDLGGRSLEPRPLRAAQRKIFARRVFDDAEGAIARLTFTLGKHKISVTRRLSDLELIEFAVDGETRPTNEIESYQVTISKLAGVWSFGDWVLLLRHLTFYFEDRRDLVWDPSAQRQILRLLFLPVETAKEWSESERRILELDSRTRNLNAALTREERALAEELSLQDTALDVREELKSLTALQDADQRRLDDLDTELLVRDRQRKEARLSLLRSEQDREATFRAIEHSKLRALAERFPSASETARYILAQLFTDARCLTCGNIAPEVSRILHVRLSESKCVVCGSDLVRGEIGAPGAPGEGEEHVNGDMSEASLEKADCVVGTARSELRKATDDHARVQSSMEELEAAIAQRRERIDALVRRLPKEEADLHEQRDELARLRSRVESLKKELASKRTTFAEFIEKEKTALLRFASEIKSSFENYASEFLIEDCSLAWSTRRERVGQSGITVDFPAFELDLTSAAFRSPVRRTGPEQVSESQREFIDLAFRMALMAVADPEHGSTLVIDAPESSLDAVFVHRAAGVLARFSTSGANRLVITSNLTDGDLIPQLLKRTNGGVGWEQRVVDLFEIAEPTAAIRALEKEYRAVKERILGTLPQTKDKR